MIYLAVYMIPLPMTSKNLKGHFSYDEAYTANSQQLEKRSMSHS